MLPPKRGVATRGRKVFSIAEHANVSFRLLGDVKGKSMIDRIAELVNSDEKLVHRGRFVQTTFLLEIGNLDYLIRIVDGRIVAVTAGPFVTPNYSFALRAPREAWETFWQEVPPPGFNDLFALFKRGLLRIEGDLHPFMANLLYFKEVLAALRRV